MVLNLALILFGFVLGVVAVVAAEALGAFLIVKWLGTKSKRDEAKIASKPHSSTVELDPQQSLIFAENKQGVIWVLESDKIPEASPEKPTKEKRRKKEIFEVLPVKKYGKIKDQVLILTDSDGVQTTVQLKGCTVEAVSATNLSSKKWAKRFPIKLESKTSAIYNGRKSLYIYLETSWDKEAWCKALRLASCDQKEKVKWFAQIHEEFLSYLDSLNTEYHTFLKPTVGSTVEVTNRASKPDGSSSKVHQFLKKIAKKSSRVGLDGKSTWTSLPSREDRKNMEKLRSSQDAVLATSFMKTALTTRHLKHSVEENTPPLSPTFSHSGSQGLISNSSDVDLNEKLTIDEGTLCWNLLISRFFFDAKSNAQLKRSMQARIQRTLAGMRTPSYVGEIICTGIQTGSLPPCIIGMRVLPMEMSEVWAFEVDIEYSGGALLEIETRLEVGELDLPPETENSDPDSNNDVDVSPDILEGFEDLKMHLDIVEGTSDSQEPKGDDEENTAGVSKSLKSMTSSSSHASRWKSVLKSIAKQVSQVPLSLAIRITSLRGTLRLHIKPPPSDQLWYGFTSMPDIDFNLESSVGDHKITSGHIAQLLVNQLKAMVQETLVLPNCESMCISWMLAEKDDWVSRDVAPFKWVNRESRKETSTSSDVTYHRLGNARSSSDCPEHREQKLKSNESSEEPNRKSVDSLKVPSSSTSPLRSSRSLDDLKTPLLGNDKPQETSEQNMEDTNDCQQIRDVEKENHPIEQPKKIGKREKMLDLRKKMTEKFEEKRRHLEEKGRLIVDKMRGP